MRQELWYKAVFQIAIINTMADGAGEVRDAASTLGDGSNPNSRKPPAKPRVPPRNKRNAARDRRKKASQRSKAGAASLEGGFSNAEIIGFSKIVRALSEPDSLKSEETLGKLKRLIDEELTKLPDSDAFTERGNSLKSEIVDIITSGTEEGGDPKLTAEKAGAIVRAIGDKGIAQLYAALVAEEKAPEAEPEAEPEPEPEPEPEVETAEREYRSALDRARAEEANPTTAMRALCTGRIPINPVLIKARIDPAACFGEWYQPGRDYPAEYHACPPNVPLFTTACGIKHMMEGTGHLNSNGKRTRTAGSEMILPVVAHIPSAARVHTLGCNIQQNERDGPEMQLVFVGISYGAVSKTSLVTVASGGQMPIPHEYGRDNFYELLGTKVRWARSKKTYGDIPDFRIAVPRTETDYYNDSGHGDNDRLFADLHETSGCRMVVQQATMMDCAVLLGT